VVAVAALLRLPGIDSRGQFDADQGHDMLTLYRFTHDGIVPLLGPKTSVADFHHGAFYYFLLAPAAALSNSDPVIVTAFIALLGIASVALTWWLARAIGGSLAGFLAGLLLAVSPAGIEQSTFIWNPNPIAFFAVLALAAAWRARTGGRAAWWAVAIGAAGAVVQLHVLGMVFLIGMLAIGALELRRDRRVTVALLGGLGVVVLVFAPLIVHELQTGFLETRRVLDWLAAGDPGPAGGPISALVFTLLRIVGWPMVGLITDALPATAIVAAIVIALAAVGLRSPREPERAAMRWLAGLLAWSTVALAFAAPSLQRVVAGLPNDHYHAFLDSVVVLLVAIPLARLFEGALAAWRRTRRPGSAVVAGALAAGMAALVLVALVRKPLADPNGGWPRLRDAGARIVLVVGSRSVQVIGLPDFKLPDAVTFPVVHAGGQLAGDPVADLELVVVACDRLFEAAIGSPCGGPAEDVVGLVSGDRALLDRFDASPRTSISIYGPPEAP
jgi:4-amino-4-deoxy-L-arabinose transferase-like glycosyltransferase